MNPSIQQDMDSVIDDLLPLIDAAQTLVPSTTGLPHIGLRSHTVTPEYGHPTAPDLLDRAPEWQPLTWQDILDELTETHSLEIPETWRVSINVDVYSAPDTGYVVRAAVVIDGQEWERRINRGPLAWMGHSWRPTPEEEHT